jgi:hypothetical protein
MSDPSNMWRTASPHTSTRKELSFAIRGSACAVPTQHRARLHSASEHLPVEHSAHGWDVFSLDEYFPDTQAVQEIAAGVIVYFPGTQAVQKLAAGVAVYFPGPQAVQKLAAGVAVYFPAGHESHASPSAFGMVPPEQFMRHSPMPVIEVSGHDKDDCEFPFPNDQK